MPLPTRPSAPARPIDRLLAEYGEDHRNPANIAIHFSAVPMIVWSALALLSRLPFPGALEIAPGLDWAWAAAGGALFYYFSLSAPLGAVMAAFAALCLALVETYPEAAPVRLSVFAGLIFTAAWILQFIGHGIEGRRPTFFHDLRFLLIGPAWLASLMFRKFGMRY